MVDKKEVIRNIPPYDKATQYVEELYRVELANAIIVEYEVLNKDVPDIMEIYNALKTLMGE